MTDGFRFPSDEYETCSATDCTHPTPWDMQGIGINTTSLVCSIECARRTLQAYSEPVESLTIHDPQYHVDRPENVRDDAVNMVREVQPGEALSDVVAGLEERVSHE